MNRRFYYVEDDDHIAVSFVVCEICHALVQNLFRDKHMEWHKEHGDRYD